MHFGHCLRFGLSLPCLDPWPRKYDFSAPPRGHTCSPIHGQGETSCMLELFTKHQYQTHQTTCQQCQYCNTLRTSRRESRGFFQHSGVRSWWHEAVCAIILWTAEIHRFQCAICGQAAEAGIELAAHFARGACEVIVHPKLFNLLILQHHKR